MTADVLLDGLTARVAAEEDPPAPPLGRILQEGTSGLPSKMHLKRQNRQCKVCSKGFVPILRVVVIHPKKFINYKRGKIFFT